MISFEIPLQPTPQSMTISLGGTVYTLTVIWNVPMQAWILDIGDASGNLLACGIPLVPGVDLLGQYGYLGIGGTLYVISDFDQYAAPTYENLGINAHLVYAPA